MSTTDDALRTEREALVAEIERGLSRSIGHWRLRLVPADMSERQWEHILAAFRSPVSAPSGEIGELVERLRALNPWTDLRWPEVLKDAATALTREHQRANAAEAEVSQLERKSAEGLAARLAAEVNAVNAKRAELERQVSDLREALRGVVRVADRKTVEFDAAHAALASTQGETT